MTLPGPKPAVQLLRAAAAAVALGFSLTLPADCFANLARCVAFQRLCCDAASGLRRVGQFTGDRQSRQTDSRRWMDGRRIVRRPDT